MLHSLNEINKIIPVQYISLKNFVHIFLFCRICFSVQKYDIDLFFIQKERLLQIRHEKELEDYEDNHMGEYVRIFPTTDWDRAKVYDNLMQSASKISLLGKSIARGSNSRRTSVCPTLLKLKVQRLSWYNLYINTLLITNHSVTIKCVYTFIC